MKANVLIPFLGLTLFASVAHSQLVTNAGGGPAQLVQNVLIGNGISASNIQFQGNSYAIGYFDGTNCNIGLDEGIILTTGTIHNSSAMVAPEGPQGPNNSPSAGVDYGGPGDPNLTNLAGEDTYDAVLLEFDFVPMNDTIQFNYVFASEEYPEYVDQGYNDIFVFYISGPGLGGTQNMALIPGTSTPVTIDNINAGSNSAYYVANGDGSTAPFNSSDYYVQYDGFTVPMTAMAEVQCGETYHLKVALADVGDGQYDSGIFLEANSFSAPTIANVENVTPVTQSGNTTTVHEGCDQIVLEFSRFGNLSDAMDVAINLSGSATEGADYSNVPSVVTFAPGQSTFQLQIDIFYDANSEGTENIVLELDIPDPCNNTSTQLFEFEIMNVEPLTVTLDNQQVDCGGDLVTLTPTVHGGSSYSYEWSTGATTPTIDVAPTSSENFWVKVTDDCTNEVKQANMTVNVPVYPPIDLLTSDDTTVICPLSPVQFFAEANGGAGSFSYHWTDGTGDWNGPVQNFAPFSSQTYTVTVEDRCGVTESHDITIHVEGTPMEVIPQPDVKICPGDSVSLTGQVQYGRPGYTYHWLHDGSQNANITVSPDETKTYIVEFRDSCDTYSVYDTILVRVVHPDADFQVLSTTRMQGLPISFGNFTTGGHFYYWDFGNGERSQKLAPQTTYEEPGTYKVMLVAESDIGCLDTTYGEITILPEFYLYIPNAFTPDGNQHNNTFGVELINGTNFSITVYNRWGEPLFTAYDPDFQWDGRYRGKLVEDGVYVYEIKVTSPEGEVIQKHGTVTVLH